MRIDIVCGNGGCFVNVEAKNLYTFNRNIQDPPPNGHLRILNQAEEFVEAATRSTDVPKPPQICLIFNSEPQEQINKGQLDSGLLDFVQSIVRMDDTNNQCELHLSNTHQSEILQLQTLPCPDNNKYSKLKLSRIIITYYNNTMFLFHKTFRNTKMFTINPEG